MRDKLLSQPTYCQSQMIQNSGAADVNIHQILTVLENSATASDSGNNKTKETLKINYLLIIHMKNDFAK